MDEVFRLNKSVGPFSAGTRVVLVEYDDVISEVRTVSSIPKIRHYINGAGNPSFEVVSRDQVEFEVETELLTLERNAAANVVGMNRRVRRANDPLVIARRMKFLGLTEIND